MLINLQSKHFTNSHAQCGRQNINHLDVPLGTANQPRHRFAVERGTFLFPLFHDGKVKVFGVPKHRIQLLPGFRVFGGRDDHFNQLDVLVGALGAEFLARNHLGNEFLYRVVVHSGQGQVPKRREKPSVHAGSPRFVGGRSQWFTRAGLHVVQPPVRLCAERPAEI